MRKTKRLPVLIALFCFLFSSCPNSRFWPFATSSPADEATPSVKPTIKPTPDTTAPAEVSELCAAFVDSKAAIFWTNPTDSDFSHVIVSYGGNRYAAMGGTYIAEGLTNGVEYSFAIITVDDSGNESAGLVADGTPAPPYDYYVRGSFNLFMGEDYPLHDDGLGGDAVSGDYVYSCTISLNDNHDIIFSTSDTEYHISYPTWLNAWLVLPSVPQSVVFSMDYRRYYDSFLPSENLIQADDIFSSEFSWVAMGDWWGTAYDADTAIMTEDSPGFFSFHAVIPEAGTYEYIVQNAANSNHIFSITGRGFRDGRKPRSLVFTTSAPNQGVLFMLDETKGRIGCRLE